MACNCKPRLPVAPAGPQSLLTPDKLSWAEQKKQISRIKQFNCLSKQSRAFLQTAVDLEKTQGTVLSKCLQSSVPDVTINSGSAIHCVQIYKSAFPTGLQPGHGSDFELERQILFHRPNLLPELTRAENPCWRWINAPTHILPELWSRDLSVTPPRWERNVLLSITEIKIRSLLSYCPALLPEPGGMTGASHTSSKHSITFPHLPQQGFLPLFMPSLSWRQQCWGSLILQDEMGFSCILQKQVK